MRVSEYEYETVKSNLTRWMTRLNRLTSFLLIKFVRGAREHMRARTHTHTCTFPFYTWFDPTKRANRHKTEVHDKEAKYKKIKSKLAFFSESVDHVWMVYFIFAMCLCVCVCESLRSISLAIFFLHLLYSRFCLYLLLHRACIM